MHVNWFWVLLVTILVIGVATVGGVVCSSATISPFAHRWDEVYTGSFTAEAVGLNLTTGNGSTTYRTWSGPGYKLVLHVRAIGMSEAQARRLAAELIKVEHGPGSITVGGDGGWFPKAAADVELYLPAGPEYHLHATTGNGAVNLEGGQYATARVQTGNGSFGGTAVIGDLEAKASNGSIRMAAAGSGRWTLTTTNGVISVDTANPGETGIMVDADTTYGKIVVDISGQRYEQKGGPGQAPLRMSTPGYEQALQHLSIRAHTSLGKIIVLPSP